MKQISAIVLTFITALWFTACDKDLKEQENELLQAWLDENEITTDAQASGLYYIESGFSGIISIGAPQPSAGDTVIVSYKGYLLADTSTIFDENTIENPLRYIYKHDTTIKGWEEGIGLMREGITAKFVVPSELGYGGKQTGVIPPYSTLIFDVRVLDIK